MSPSLMHAELQAKTTHLSMCIKLILLGSPVAVGDSVLVLLDKLTSTGSEETVSVEAVKAIRQALPGSQLHQTRFTPFLLSFAMGLPVAHRYHMCLPGPQRMLCWD